MRSPSLAFITVASLCALPPAVAQHPTRGPSIPQVAKTAGQFTTLLAAVDAAGLTETLLGRGPFTLFAPTDEAFSKLPTVSEVDSALLLIPRDQEEKRKILSDFAPIVTRWVCRTCPRRSTI